MVLQQKKIKLALSFFLSSFLLSFLILIFSRLPSRVIVPLTLKFIPISLEERSSEERPNPPQLGATLSTLLVQFLSLLEADKSSEAKKFYAREVAPFLNYFWNELGKNEDAEKELLKQIGELSMQALGEPLAKDRLGALKKLKLLPQQLLIPRR